MSTNDFGESIPIQLVTLLNKSVRDWFQEPEHEKPIVNGSEKERCY